MLIQFPQRLKPLAYTSEIEKLERRWLENPKGRNFAPLADAYRKAGEVDRAIDLCKSGLELHPDYVSAHIVYGRCLIDRKDDAGATEVFQKVLSLDPENILALRILSEIAERTGQFEQGAEWLGRLLNADPMNGDAAESLARMKGKAAQAKAAPPPDAAAPPEFKPPATFDTDAIAKLVPESPASAAAVVEVESVPSEPAPAEIIGIERTSIPDLPEPPARISLVDAATTPMEQPDFTLERASGAFAVEPPAAAEPPPPIDADSLIEREPELPSVDLGGGDQRMSVGIEAEPELPGQGTTPGPRHSLGLESFDGIDFGAGGQAAPIEGMVPDEPPPVEAEAVPRVEIEGLARTQYEGSGMFKLDQPLLESTATPHLESDGPSVSLPLIRPEDVTPAAREPASPPPTPEFPEFEEAEPPARRSHPALVSDTADDVGAADTATLSQAEPVLTETMAELYLQQGHRDDALRVYQALLVQRPGDGRLLARVAEIEGPVLTSFPARGPASGQPLGAFLKRILSARPGAPAAEPLPEGVAPAPRQSTGATPQSMLEEAFGDEPPLGPTPGSPSRPAADSLSLDAVFGDDGGRGSLPRVEAPRAPDGAASAAAGKGGFSFDDFFGASGQPGAPGSAPDEPASAEPAPPAPRASTATPTPRPSTRQSRPAAPVEDAGDLDQFQAWLKGLKS